MDALGNINAHHKRMINLANPRTGRDAVNLNTCRDLISLWLPKRKDQTTSQVFTSLNQSVLQDMLDPIEDTDGVNKQYLEKRMDEHSMDVIERFFDISMELATNPDMKKYDRKQIKNKFLELMRKSKGIKPADEKK